MSFEAVPASSIRIQIPVLGAPQQMAAGRLVRRIPAVRALLRAQRWRVLAIVFTFALIAAVVGVATKANVFAVVFAFELGALAAIVMFRFQASALYPRVGAVDAWPDHLTLLYDTGTLAVRGWDRMDLAVNEAFVVAATMGKALVAIPRAASDDRLEGFLAVARAGGATVADP